MKHLRLYLITIGLSILILGGAWVKAQSLGPQGVWDLPWGNFTIGIDTPSAYLTDPDPIVFNNTVIEKDVLLYPTQPASYIIWRSGSTYYAKDGTNGSIITSGASASVVMNAARAAVDSVGRGIIHIREGNYTITTPITLTSGVYYSWVGSGIDTTRLTVANNANCNVFQYTGNTRIQWPTFRDFSIDGNKDNNTGGTGIYIVPSASDAIDGRIENVFIFNMKTDGIYISTSWGWIIENVVIQGSEGIGISMAGGAAQLLNSKIESCEGTQGVFFSSEDGLVDGCQIQSNTQTGLRLNNVIGAKVANCWFYNQGGAFASILVGSTTNRCIITGCTFDGNSATNYGINVGWAGAQNTIIEDNQFTAHATSGIKDSGTGTKIVNNIGFVTENDGSTTLSTTFVNITHGLSYTPSAGDITLTFGAGGTYNCSVGISFYGATYFTVRGYDSSGVNKKPSSAITINWKASRD